MKKQDVIEIILRETDPSTIIVSNLGDTSCELYELRDRARNFYMLGSYGMAASLGLGLALVREEPVVVIDGDGALLYNLGCLATEGRYRCRNLIHVVLDNGAFGATGYQPTATAVNVSLAEAGRACGIRSRAASSPKSFASTLVTALSSAGPHLLIARVTERPSHPAPLTPLSGTQIAERFREALGGSPAEAPARAAAALTTV